MAEGVGARDINSWSAVRTGQARQHTPPDVSGLAMAAEFHDSAVQLHVAPMRRQRKPEASSGEMGDWRLALGVHVSPAIKDCPGLRARLQPRGARKDARATAHLDTHIISKFGSEIVLPEPLSSKRWKIGPRMLLLECPSCVLLWMIWSVSLAPRT